APFHSPLPHPYPHRKRVDKQSHPSIRPFSSLHPSQQHRPKYHILSPRNLPQHPCPGHMTHTRCAHSQFPRSFTYPAPQSHFHHHAPLLDPSSSSLHIQHPIRRRRLLHISQELSEILFMLLRLHPQARLRHQVAERLRLSQPLSLTRQIRL